MFIYLTPWFITSVVHDQHASGFSGVLISYGIQALGQVCCRWYELWQMHITVLAKLNYTETNQVHKIALLTDFYTTNNGEVDTGHRRHLGHEAGRQATS